MSSSKKLTSKGTLRQELIRDFRLQILSIILVFSTQLYICCSSNLLSRSTLPPFPVSKYSTYRKYVDGGERCWVLLETIFCRSLSLCSWPDSEPTKLKQKPRRGGGLRQMNTCRKAPLKVNFSDYNILFWWLHIVN
jgi:hypothetical protein